MNIKKLIFLILPLSIISGCLSNLGNNNEVRLHIQLDGKQYDKLRASFRINEFSGPKEKIEGQSSDGSNWLFVIPDSIFQSYYHLALGTYLWEQDSTIDIAGIAFGIIRDKDTLSPLVGPLNFDKNSGDIYLKAKFKKRLTATDGLLIKNPDGTSRYAKEVIDHFYIQNPDQETLLSLPRDFPRFPGRLHPDKTDDQLMDENTEIIRRNPDSRALMTKLYGGRKSFGSQESIRKLYDTFSENAKNAHFGQLVRQYIHTMPANNIHTNTQLPNAVTGEQQWVVQDTSRYTLVVFSASWCGPCHKMIPLLKQIDTDLKEKLEIVYVSKDEAATVDEWKQLMKDEQIPWRSLWAEDQKNIETKYPHQTIPTCWLITPEKKMIRLDPRREKEKLYEIVKRRN